MSEIITCVLIVATLFVVGYKEEAQASSSSSAITTKYPFFEFKGEVNHDS